ncbi:MAG: hypothetical protein HY813_01855, partial [Candidatus Portnoybacteria bacterium]|nr:hypothetical protein [Candidatus Portnoybacteria bacterium]
SQKGGDTAARSASTGSPTDEMFVIRDDMPTTENPNIETVAVGQLAEAPRSGFISSLKTVLTSPRVIINLLFIILGGIIFLVLMLKLLSRTGIRYAPPIFNGLLILVILISLFYFNHYLLLARAQIF